MVSGSSKGGITGWLWRRCGRGSPEVEKISFPLLLAKGSHVIMYIYIYIFSRFFFLRVFLDTTSPIFFSVLPAGFRSNPTFMMSSTTLTAPSLRRKKRMGFCPLLKGWDFVPRESHTACHTIVMRLLSYCLHVYRI